MSFSTTIKFILLINWHKYKILQLISSTYYYNTALVEGEKRASKAVQG